MANLDLILSRLHKVKTLGNNSYSALCPVHEEKTPSFNIKLLDDDRVIMHCFGCGCTGVDALRALDIELDAMFPEKIDGIDKHGYKMTRKPFFSEEKLKSLALESTIIMLAANDVLRGKQLSDDDIQRIELASKRFYEACII